MLTGEVSGKKPGKRIDSLFVVGRRVPAGERPGERPTPLITPETLADQFDLAVRRNREIGVMDRQSAAASWGEHRVGRDIKEHGYTPTP